MTTNKPSGPVRRRPTSRDVAARAGVGQATVSRVLTGDPRVSEATRAKVHAALRELDYAPNEAARVMKTGRTGNVGVVVARLSNPLYPKLLDAIGSQLSDRDLRMTVWNSEHGGNQSARDAVAARSIDGLVLATATRSEVPLWGALGIEAPVVLINRAIAELPFDSVTSDNAGGAAAVAEHFLQAGHRRIACITGSVDLSTIREREEGFRSSLQKADQPLAGELLQRVNIGHAEGHVAMRNLLQRVERPTAVFCTNDLLAMGASDGARSLGVRVPGEVAIAGFDDVAQASWEGYQLTSVHQALELMVHDALDLLLDRIENPQREPENKRLATKLILRRSTGTADSGPRSS
ncbi:MAG: LacI family DNA-binding transcriptional regulator [Nocardioidaceae bacterium]